MKHLLRISCALLIACSIVSPTFAETTNSSILSSVSINIGGKPHTGEEAKNILLSRARSLASVKTTDSEKIKVLASFNVKLSSLIRTYSKKTGKASKNLVAILQATKAEITADIAKLQKKPTTIKAVDTTKPISVVNTGNTTTTNSPSSNSIDASNVNATYKACIAKASTPIQTLYVNDIFDIAKSTPANWWKTYDEVFAYMKTDKIDGLNYPNTRAIVLKQAIKDLLARKIGVQYLDEAFKTLPTDFSADTISTTSSSTKNTTSTSYTSTVWDNVTNGLLDYWLSVAKTNPEKAYVYAQNILWNYFTNTDIKTKTHAWAYEYLIYSKFSLYANKWPKDTKAVLDQAIDDRFMFVNKKQMFDNQYFHTAFKTLPATLSK